MHVVAYFIGFKGSTRVNQFIQKNDKFDFFELINAVNGKTLPLVFLKKFFSDIFFKRQMANKGHLWLAGTAGCFLSHIKAIEQAESQQADFVIIAEDDAVFRRNPKSLIDLMNKEQVDLLYLNDRMRPKLDNIDLSSNSIILLTDENLIGTGAEAYILSKKGITALLQLFNMALKNGLPTGYDGFLQSFVIRKGKKVKKTGGKSLDNWVKLRKGGWLNKSSIELKVGIAIPSLVAHVDDGVSIINQSTSLKE